METIKYQFTVRMITEQCCNCGVTFGLPEDLYAVLRKDTEKYFYCPNGHPQHYTQSTNVRLNDEIKRTKDLERQLSEARDKMWNIETDKINIEMELKLKNKQLKRIHKGVCPCCNRSFMNLKDHIETQHPELIGKDKYVHMPAKNKAN